MQTTANIIQLRELLAERFPTARLGLRGRREVAGRWATGLPALDDVLGGGLPKGGITELVSSGTSGSGLLLLALLRRAAEVRCWLALVDAKDSFDPTAPGNRLVRQLLWVRCRRAAEALKATDLLLRDGNLPLVILDLALNGSTELRKVPAPTWYRMQRVIEMGTTALLVMTPRPMVSGALARVKFVSRFTLDDLASKPEALLPSLRLEWLEGQEAKQQRAVGMAEAG